ncbi:MAG: MBG domain-containing protein [Bacteroidales bacterium]
MALSTENRRRDRSYNHPSAPLQGKGELLNFLRSGGAKNILPGLKFVLQKVLLPLVLGFILTFPVHAQVAGDYQTRFTNSPSRDWSVANNWQEYNGTDWVNASEIPGADNKVTIRNGANYTYNVTESTIAELVVENTGLLEFSSDQNRALTVNGNLSGTGEININQTGRSHTLNLGGSLNSITTFTSNNSGTVNYFREGDQEVFESLNYGNLTISGSGTKTLQGDVTLAGNLDIQSAILESDAYNFTVSGTSGISGKFSDNFNGGINNFTGLITINAGGEWDTQGSTSSGNLRIHNGITQNNISPNSFLAGGGRFYTNNQNIEGTGPLEFFEWVYVADHIIVTNLNISQLTFHNVLRGYFADSEWINGADSHISFQGTNDGSEPMSTGILTATALNNIVEYSYAGNQLVNPTTYYHLILDNGGQKRLQDITGVLGNIEIKENTTLSLHDSPELNISGSLSIDSGGTLRYGTTGPSGTTNLDGDLIAGPGTINMEGTNHVLNLNGANNALGSLEPGTSSTVNYTANSGQEVFASQDYYNLGFSGTGTKTLSGNVRVSNELSMTGGNVNAGVNILELGTGTGNPGTITHTSGNITGKFERWVNTTTEYLFPVGTASDNNHATINFSNLTSGSLILEFIPGDPGNTGLPLNDDGTEITNQFTNGYWSALANNSLASGDYSINLNAAGFDTYSITEDTRIIKRTDGSAWFMDGSHLNADGVTIKRTELDGIHNLASGTQFGIGRSKTTITIGGSFTALDKIYDGETTATIDVNNLELVGVESGDNVTLTNIVLEFADFNVGTHTVSITSADITGDDAYKYTLSLTGAPTTEASITPKEITITPDAGQIKTYGQVDPTLSYTHTPLEGSDEITGVLGRNAGEDVGTYNYTLGTLTAGSNYNLVMTVTPATFEISPLAVTVTADAKTKTYGDTDPALTFTSAPAVGSILDNAEVISFTGELSRDAGEDVGDYPITQGTLNNTNYSISYTGANLTISPLAVTVTADAKTKTYGDTDPALTFTSAPAVGSILDNGETIAFSGALDRDPGEDVGTYAITQGTLASDSR